MAEDTQLQQHEHEKHIKNIDAVNETARVASKYLMMVAGAAAVAVLAFLGQLVSNDTSGQMLDVAVMVPSLYAFGVAAFLGAISPMLANWQIVIEVTTRNTSDRWAKLLARCHVGCMVGGWVLFLWGLCSAGQAIQVLQMGASA